MLPVAHVHKKFKLPADGVCAVPMSLTRTQNTPRHFGQKRGLFNKNHFSAFQSSLFSFIHYLVFVFVLRAQLVTAEGAHGAATSATGHRVTMTSAQHPQERQHCH